LQRAQLARIHKAGYGGGVGQAQKATQCTYVGGVVYLLEPLVIAEAGKQRRHPVAVVDPGVAGKQQEVAIEEGLLEQWEERGYNQAQAKLTSTESVLFVARCHLGALSYVVAGSQVLGFAVAAEAGRWAAADRVIVGILASVVVLIGSLELFVLQQARVQGRQVRQGMRALLDQVRGVMMANWQVAAVCQSLMVTVSGFGLAAGLLADAGLALLAVGLWFALELRATWMRSGPN
jgi:hypothetical protein